MKVHLTNQHEYFVKYMQYANATIKLQRFIRSWLKTFTHNDNNKYMERELSINKQKYHS